LVLVAMETSLVFAMVQGLDCYAFGSCLRIFDEGWKHI
jgi:hypothetical protein